MARNGAGNGNPDTLGRSGREKREKMGEKGRKRRANYEFSEWHEWGAENGGETMKCVKNVKMGLENGQKMHFRPILRRQGAPEGGNSDKWLSSRAGRGIWAAAVALAFAKTEMSRLRST